MYTYQKQYRHASGYASDIVELADVLVRSELLL